MDDAVMSRAEQLLADVETAAAAIWEEREEAGRLAQEAWDAQSFHGRTWQDGRLNAFEAVLAAWSRGGAGAAFEYLKQQVEGGE